MKNKSLLFFLFSLIFTVLFLAASAQNKTNNGAQPSDSKNNKNISKETLTSSAFEIVDFSGEGTYEIFPGAEWTFFGPVRAVTVNNNQKIVGTGTAVFGMTSGRGQIAFSLCYQKAGTAQVVSLLGDNHLVADVGSERHPFSVSGTATLPAGVYSVGYCVINRGKQVIGNNNYVNGWMMITN